MAVGVEIDNLDDYRGDDGKLIAVGLGCYNVIYVASNGNTYCADCAQKAMDSDKGLGITLNSPVKVMSEADTDGEIRCETCDKVLSEEYVPNSE